MEGDQNSGQPGQPQPINAPIPPTSTATQPAASGSGSTLVIILKIFAVLVVIGMVMAMVVGVAGFFLFKKVADTVKENVDVSEEGGVSIKDPRTGEEVLGLASGAETLPRFIEYYDIPVYPGAKLDLKSEVVIGGVPFGMAGFRVDGSIEDLKKFFEEAAIERGWGAGVSLEDFRNEEFGPGAPFVTDVIHFEIKGEAGGTIMSVGVTSDNMYVLLVNPPVKID